MSQCPKTDRLRAMNIGDIVDFLNAEAKPESPRKVALRGVVTEDCEPIVILIGIGRATANEVTAAYTDIKAKHLAESPNNRVIDRSARPVEAYLAEI